jgi:DNA-directed RNA polymerase subunit RPC12/RpoP
MHREKSRVIDLSKISGSGEFSCPKCGSRISPDDPSEDSYMIVEPVVKDDRLEMIILQCKKCGVKIRLVGFNVLED